MAKGSSAADPFARPKRSWAKKRTGGVTARERRIIELLYPDKSIALGLSVCAELHARKILEIDYRRHRYVLTEAGRALYAQRELTL